MRSRKIAVTRTVDQVDVDVLVVGMADRGIMRVTRLPFACSEVGDGVALVDRAAFRNGATGEKQGFDQLGLT